MPIAQATNTVTILNDALHLFQANETDLAIGKIAPVTLLTQQYFHQASDKDAVKIAQEVTLALIGFGAIIPQLQAGNAPGASVKMKSHMVYLVNSNRELFTADELTQHRVKQALLRGRQLYSKAQQSPIGITRSQLDNEVNKVKAEMHELRCIIERRSQLIETRNAEIEKLEARIDIAKGKNAADQEVIDRRVNECEKLQQKLDKLEAQRK